METVNYFLITRTTKLFFTTTNTTKTCELTLCLQLAYEDKLFKIKDFCLFFFKSKQMWESLPCRPSPVLPSYHQDQAHTAVGGGSGPAGCGRGAPGPSRGSGGEGRTWAGADSRSSVDSRSPRSTGPTTRPGWTKQCCDTDATFNKEIWILQFMINIKLSQPRKLYIS